MQHIYNLSVSRVSSPLPPPTGVARLLYAFAEIFRQHWLAIFTGILFFYALLPFGAPLLKQAGLDGVAQVIYQPYKLVCHTYGFRSMYLFGEQFTYTREEFNAKSGIDTLAPGNMFSNLLAARDFQGNLQMGYKVALCERDVALYLSMALGGVIYGLAQRRVRHMPWWLFVLIGIAPIGLDGFSQLFSQAPFYFIQYRESTVALRMLTGSLFGLSMAWLVFPIIESTFAPEMATTHES